MKVTLGTFKGTKGTPFVALIIDNYAVAMKSITDIVGHSIIAMTLHPHGLYDNDRPIVDINTGKEVYARLLKRLQKKGETVMNYDGGNCSLDLYTWEEVSRVTCEYPYETNLRDLLIKENKQYEISEIYN